MILSFFGVILVLLKGNFALLFSLHFNSGDLWMIAAVCIWGMYSVCSKWATKTTTPLMATLYSGIFGVILLLPFNIGSFTVTNINTSFITSLLYTGLISTVLCMVFWNVGVQNQEQLHPAFSKLQSHFHSYFSIPFPRRRINVDSNFRDNDRCDRMLFIFPFQNSCCSANQSFNAKTFLIRKHRQRSGDVFIYVSFLSHTAFLLLAINVLSPFQYHHLEFPTKVMLLNRL